MEEDPVDNANIPLAQDADELPRVVVEPPSIVLMIPEAVLEATETSLPTSPLLDKISTLPV